MSIQPESSSKKRARQQQHDTDAAVSSITSELSSKKESDETLFWKNSYYEMKKLRTEAEKDLETERQLRHSNDDVLKQTRSLVQQQTETSLKNGQEKSSSSSSTSTETQQAAMNSEDEKEQLLKIIKLYETMTAMSVKLKNDKYCCTMKNSETRQAVRFLIYESSTEEGELVYEPSANTEILPEYLAEEALSFVPLLGPVLLGDVIASLFVAEDNEDDRKESSDEDGDEDEE